ncbi:MAG: hypothetical protein KAH31_09845 [Candidatus Sabulitectum sp.]|nr:hypothetical protein [Candidatus Sabulitectum sp.]
MAFYEEFSRHSISIAFMPYPEAYTRKIGYFWLAAGIGFASANLDIDEATVLYTTTAEYRQ